MDIEVSLYNRLLKYQGTDTRSNLENFSTEILCDFLNRVSMETTDLFLRHVVFSGMEDSVYSSFKDNHETNDENIKFNWRTQYAISISGTAKFPDLIGFVDHKPAILIEVKIGAGFTHRKHYSENGGLVYIPQLIDYGNWLNRSNANAILVLLSHSTSPPEDFLISKEKKYGIELRNHVTWNQVYRWLKIVSDNHQEECLARDFMKYLLEQNMAVESPVREDFSVLELFVSGAGKRIEDMMRYIREELEKKHKLHMSWGKEKSYLNNGLYFNEYQQKCIWSWVILDSAEYAYLSWGICYPDEADEWGLRKHFPSLPKDPFVFINICSDKKGIIDNYKNALDIRPKGWHWNEKLGKEYDTNNIGIKFHNLAEFVTFDKDSTKEVFDFIDRGFQEISELVDKIIIKQ